MPKYFCRSGSSKSSHNKQQSCFTPLLMKQQTGYMLNKYILTSKRFFSPSPLSIICIMSITCQIVRGVTDSDQTYQDQHMSMCVSVPLAA